MILSIWSNFTKKKDLLPVSVFFPGRIYTKIYVFCILRFAINSIFVAVNSVSTLYQKKIKFFMDVNSPSYYTNDQLKCVQATSWFIDYKLIDKKYIFCSLSFNRFGFILVELYIQITVWYKFIIAKILWSKSFINLKFNSIVVREIASFISIFFMSKHQFDYVDMGLIS